ncbi:hypothetical protein L596_030729 [Steinernema carpocapsae]|uniref:Uncharacterized protein n=1 Tax=Steinernema carpocapsae TaxID=34508 RepID=A0A4U5LNJ9_STECR|nr:hypothetical protein L596_030729 [Steinernema carpocapsae]
MTYLNEKPNPYRKGFLISLASLFCVAVLLVNLSSNIIEMNVSQIKSQTFEKTALSKEERFVPQCQLPYMDPWDPDIRKFDDPNYKPPCKKTGKQLTQLTDGKVVLDKEFKGRCQARCLWPVNDKNYKPDIWKDVKDFIAKCDVVEVHCTSEGSNKAKYQFIHSQIVERKTTTLTGRSQNHVPL